MKQSIGQKLKLQLILLLARKLPPCNVLLPLFSEERERPLTLREKTVKKLHLFTCEACRRYVVQIEKMSETIKSQNETETVTAPSAKLSDDARTRIRAALEAAAHGRQK